ncbi:hypothetical protein C1H46_027313 [Malus baccata]|uniref:Uncharacterized protein n=1 Tax=Malus baccata TaxID=106549 RepID=A0A540LL20_MALBA|nr:hypothetical protein C1H46_027313 [Malus baccata]
MLYLLNTEGVNTFSEMENRAPPKNKPLKSCRAKELEFGSAKKVVEAAKKKIAQLQLKTERLGKKLSKVTSSKLQTLIELGSSKDAT